jgi:hypothetical protein
MTTCYEWFSFPEEFSVVCPDCGGECIGSEVPNIKQTLLGPRRYKPDGLPGPFECKLCCPSCGFNARRFINWPNDAYWKCDIKGKTLWAWSLEHTNVLLNYIQSQHRNNRGYPGYCAALLHLPTHFELAKNRKVVVKSLRKLMIASH